MALAKGPLLQYKRIGPSYRPLCLNLSSSQILVFNDICQLLVLCCNLVS